MLLELILRAERHSYDECTEVSAFCPVEATVLGYYPNKGGNIFFALCFGVLTIASLVLGIWKRTWTFAATLTAGIFLETCGMYTNLSDRVQGYDDDANGG